MAEIIVFDRMMCKSPDVPFQDELLTRTSQLKTSKSSIIATQVGHITVLRMINTAARPLRAHLDFCTSWHQTQWFLLF